MSRVRKLKSKKSVVNQSNEVVVLHQQLQQQKLLKINRFLIYGIFTLMLTVIVLGFVFIPDNQEKVLLNIDNSQLISQTQFKNPVLNAEVEHLKGQLVSVVSGSIEGKLSSLEESIKLGSVLGSLETLNGLRKDVKALRNYSLPEKKQLQQTAEVNKALVAEVSQLRNLIYFTLGSCSLMFAAFTLVWLKNRKRLHYQPSYIDMDVKQG